MNFDFKEITRDINLFHKYLLSTYEVPSTVLVAGEWKLKTISAPLRLTLLIRKANQSITNQRRKY